MELLERPFLDRLAPHVVQREAWERFLSLGLPSRADETYRYVKLKNLFEAEFILPTSFPTCEKSDLVFVNGRFAPELSSPPENLIVTPLEEAFQTYAAFLEHRYVKEESDPFACLNGALASKGLFLTLPAGTVLEKPVEIVHITEGEALATPRIHLFAGKSSQATFVHRHRGSGAHWVNSVVDYLLEENARITLVHDEAPNLQMWRTDAFRATLKRDARLKTIALGTGGATTRHDYHVKLLGEGASVSLIGGTDLKERTEAHTNVLIEHIAPHCTSSQTFKAVLDDFSRSSFEGKIYVHSAAQKTEAYQLSNNLLLSDKAIAYAKPNLEIFADDVKASHGATVGQLDAEHLFYLKARGIPHPQAQKILIEAFRQEILQQLPTGVQCVL